MAVKIYIPAGAVWQFYEDNKERCQKEMILIAENTDTDYGVYLTADSSGPLVQVCRGDESPEYEEELLDSPDTAETILRVYKEFIDPEYDEDGIIDDVGFGMSRVQAEDTVYEREDELYQATYDFLSVVFREGERTPDWLENEDIVGGLLDGILNYLMEDQELQAVYRPTIITDEKTGEDIFIPYPYKDPEPVPYEEGDDEDGDDQCPT